MVRGGRGRQFSSLFTFNLLLFTFCGRDVHGTRQRREAYTHFAGKNDVLKLDNSRFFDEKSEIQGT